VSSAQALQGSAVLGPIERRWLRRRVLEWYDEHGRDFPWRERPEPYRVLLAELLLQRTRADLVLPVYEQFVLRYPHATALAAADPVDVEAFLRPLGFAHRNARLPQIARELCERHDGQVPRSKEALLALSGVGEYVANAVLAVAFGERRPLLDPNVIRLIGRAIGWRSPRPRPRDDRALWGLLSDLMPKARAASFALALVDLGAVICRTRRPRCHECPLSERCAAFAAGEVNPARTA
jgi:A/G-specific adenine glycosylase